MEYTREEIELINRTARSWTKPPLIYRLVSKTYRGQKLRILDYGAGPRAIWTCWLKRQGFNAVAYDVGANQTALHDSNALEQRYDIVIASNVLNVQPSKRRIIQVLSELKIAPIIYLNYPESPRKSSVTLKELKCLCDKAFESVELSGIIFSCHNPL